MDHQSAPGGEGRKSMDRIRIVGGERLNGTYRSAAPERRTAFDNPSLLTRKTLTLTRCSAPRQ